MFFLRTTLLHVVKGGFGGAQRGIGCREFGYSFRVVQFEEEVASFDLLRDLHVDLRDDPGGGGVSLKLVDGLDFAVGGDGAYEILTSDWSHAHFKSVAAGRAHDNEGDDSKCEEDDP